MPQDELSVVSLREMLEPCAVRAARTVLRGGRCSDTPSLPDPQAGSFSLTHDNRVCLSKIGSIKARLHRPLEGTPKTCTIKYEAGQWYAVFSCEVAEVEPLPEIASEIGIDLGITHFAALSDGTFIESPRYYRKAQKKLEKLQQALSRKQRGSHHRGKAVKQVAKAHRKIANQRRDFHHKQAKQLVKQHQTIVFEELKITNASRRAKPKQDEHGMYLPNGAAAKSGLNKSILDAGWGEFQQIVSHKAACAGRTVLKVSPGYTSQVCSQCGTLKKKDLSERWHSCKCGAELDRDTNAAINILRLGRSQREDAPRVESSISLDMESRHSHLNARQTSSMEATIQASRTRTLV